MLWEVLGPSHSRVTALILISCYICEPVVVGIVGSSSRLRIIDGVLEVRVMGCLIPSLLPRPASFVLALALDHSRTFPFVLVLRVEPTTSFTMAGAQTKGTLMRQL